MYLKILHKKGVVRFGKIGDSNPHYVCPYEILQMVGKADYELRLPREFASVRTLPCFYA